MRDRTVGEIAHHARGVLASSDPEHLHQLRVGQRRLRAALRAFRSLLAPKKRKRLVRDLRRLSPVLGTARDWDVLLGRTRVEQKARAKAAAARADAVEAVGSRAFARMLGHAAAVEADASDEPLASFAARALERAHGKLLKRTRKIDWSHPRERHAARIAVKRLRYTAEFFAPAFPGNAAPRYIASLKELQSILGELNDIAVGRRLAGVDTDDAPLLTRLVPAWARFAKRRPFWRAPERKPRRAAR